MAKKKNKNIVKKTGYKPIKSLSATKAISAMAAAQGPMVREVERPEIVEDKRSLFFKDEFTKEINRERKWLG